MPVILIPKFKYNFNLSDLVYGLFQGRKPENHDILKKHFATDYVYFTNYARTALTLLLKSIAKGKVLNVGVQVFTCQTIFESIRNAGCIPVFLDINNNFTLDTITLKQRIENIDILIVTHTFGIPADVDEIRQIAVNKIIIEDCAHSLFTEYKGRPTGTFFDASIFSIGYGKYPSVGTGGFAIVNNRELMGDFLKLHKALPAVSIFKEVKKVIQDYLYAIAFSKYLYGIITYPLGKKLERKYDFIGKSMQQQSKGFTCNANIFTKNFVKYITNNEIQRINGNYLSIQIKNFIKIPEDFEGKINYYIYPLSHANRDDIVSELFTNGIESGKHFSKSINWASEFGYIAGTCPNTEIIVKTIFTVPSYYSLTKREISTIANILVESAK